MPQQPVQKVTALVTNLANKIMPADLPKSYKVAVFKEANKPLTFEERELKLPEDGEVSRAATEGHHAALTQFLTLGSSQSPSLWCLPL